MVLPGCQDTGTAICMGKRQLINSFYNQIIHLMMHLKERKDNMFGLMVMTKRVFQKVFIILIHQKICVIPKLHH